MEFKLKSLKSSEVVFVKCNDIIGLMTELVAWSELCKESVFAYIPGNVWAVANVFYHKGTPLEFKVDVNLF